MEFRYVYRRVEDAIGSPLAIEESRHSAITRRLRYAVREMKDVAHNTEVTALCLSALAGNSSIDAVKMVDHISRLIDTSMSQAIPYMKQEEERQAERRPKDDYAAAFEELARFTEALNAEKAKKAAELVEGAGERPDEKK